MKEHTTRVRNSDTQQTFALIFTYNNLEIENIRYDILLKKSDHTALDFEYVVGEEITMELGNPNAKRKYYDGNNTELKNFCRKIKWEMEFSRSKEHCY